MVIVSFTPAVVKNGRRIDKQNITAQAVIFHSKTARVITFLPFFSVSP